jgi:hypothetical protein
MLMTSTDAEAVFKEKRVIWGPYAGADYNLTVSHNRLRSPVSFPIRSNADECFPSYSKMEQPIGRGRGGSWLYVLKIGILWSMPELILTPLHS